MKLKLAAIAALSGVMWSGAASALTITGVGGPFVTVVGDWNEPALADGLEVGLGNYPNRGNRTEFGQRGTAARSTITGGVVGLILYDSYVTVNPDGDIIDSGTIRTERLTNIITSPPPNSFDNASLNGFHFYTQRSGFHGGYRETDSYVVDNPDGSRTQHIVASNLYLNLEFRSDVSRPFLLEIFEVPEPGTWALMILGFGMCGGALRRRIATAGASTGRGE